MPAPLPPLQLSSSSSAAARGGSARNAGGNIRDGERAYGGININSGGGGFEIPKQTIIIGAVLVGLFLFAKNKKYI